jgi:glyoxylase-like metal-dependent hydrolase (beta-lactamase superfamily II)/rhodanese-related sulfurtransferase
VLFSQVLNDDLGCASYVVGCEEAEEAVVVDPPLAIEPVLREAERLGARIVRTLETHTHADHVSGHGRLALEHGIPVSIHPAAEPEYPHDVLADGDELAIGNVTLRCLHTPGHRPEHCCFAVIDTTRADEPCLVLTGDSLFVGDVARPDLAVGASEGAEGMFHSLRRLFELPDGVEVFPGHVAGSLCGKSMSSRGSTTIGFERRFNSMVAITDLDVFVVQSSDVSTPKPPNINRIVALNRGPFVAALPDVEELSTPPDNSQLLDVRPVEDHLGGHRPGAVNVPVAGTSFSTKAGFVLDADAAVTVLAANAGEAARAVAGLRSVAFPEIPGYVLGGGSETTSSVALDELERTIDEGATVIDVREKDERDEGYIPGSRHVPYRLMRLCCPDIPDDRPVVTICGSGPRAAIAASVLRAKGLDARPVVDGGMDDWLARGSTAVSFRRCGSS